MREERRIESRRKERKRKERKEKTSVEERRGEERVKWRGDDTRYMRRAVTGVQ